MNKRLRAVLDAANGFDAVLVTDSVARRYLTGFESSDAGTLVITDADAAFIIDARYFEAAEKQISHMQVILQQKLYEQMSHLLGGAKRVAVQSCITVAELDGLRTKLSGYEIEAVAEIDRVLSRLRAVKTDEEINSVIAAQRIAEAAFDHILGFIKEGVTDIEIAAELEYIMRRMGAERMSFDTIAVSGSHSSVPHGVPTLKKVRPGDFITMDFGAVIDGCHSDMTRTVALGFATDEMRAVYDTVLAAQQAALNAICHGAPCSAVDAAARDVITAAGYGQYFAHSTGHGVGYEIHEAPTLSPRGEGGLESGNIVTVEPGIYLPGRFGVRIEDMALVTHNGHKNLTNAPKQLIIV